MTSLEDAFEASWPAAEYIDTGAVRTGRGLGGGMRVSSARIIRPDWTKEDIEHAIYIHRKWSQPPVFRLTDEDDKLARLLTARGWSSHKLTWIMTTSIDPLINSLIPLAMCFTIWPPLGIQRSIWIKQGIGPKRQAVMSRADTPKTTILGRVDDHAAGVCFVAVSDDIAAIHAVEVLPDCRRKGLATAMLYEAAVWAGKQGAKKLLIAVTAKNIKAVSLYRKLGFKKTTSYCYFIR